MVSALIGASAVGSPQEVTYTNSSEYDCNPECNQYSQEDQHIESKPFQEENVNLEKIMHTLFKNIDERTAYNYKVTMDLTMKGFMGPSVASRIKGYYKLELKDLRQGIENGKVAEAKEINPLTFDTLNGRTCLHCAAYYGNSDCLKTILCAFQTSHIESSWGYVWFVNVKDGKGETPLHLAARQRSYFARQCMGADQLQRDDSEYQFFPSFKLAKFCTTKYSYELAESCLLILKRNPSYAEPLPSPSVIEGRYERGHIQFIIGALVELWLDFSDGGEGDGKNYSLISYLSNKLQSELQIGPVVAGKFVNAYSTNDWMLGVAFCARLTFPDLDSLVNHPIDYARVVKRIGNEMDSSLVDLQGLLPLAITMVVTVTASTTTGKTLLEHVLERTLEACDRILAFSGRDRIASGINS
ncbi:E3 ubiquitin-protein ligase XB3 [Capsicum baccatum]|uniref:E3 ubiquitin-protein ligase XB3 n=1 Tax=Capsicum baccatum TaxID=33114 RepID=A0A2G2VF01_CAPBA|nr:E3 ubiquitin-protein ligase XB3 [Capsicum baccatum]